MDFVTAVHYAKFGYRIKRSDWGDDRWLDQDAPPDGYRWMENALANDWEIITEGIVEHFPYIVYSDEID